MNSKEVPWATAKLYGDESFTTPRSEKRSRDSSDTETDEDNDSPAPNPRRQRMGSYNKRQRVGAKGIAGKRGEKGAQGARGEKGEKGLRGAQGPSGVVDVAALKLQLGVEDHGPSDKQLKMVQMTHEFALASMEMFAAVAKPVACQPGCASANCAAMCTSACADANCVGYCACAAISECHPAAHPGPGLVCGVNDGQGN